MIFIVALDNGGCARWRVEYGWIHGGFIDQEIAVASKSSANNVICRPNLEFLLLLKKWWSNWMERVFIIQIRWCILMWEVGGDKRWTVSTMPHTSLESGSSGELGMHLWTQIRVHACLLIYAEMSLYNNGFPSSRQALLWILRTHLD